MASIGMTRDKIAEAIGITKPTLNRHFGEELTRGHKTNLAMRLREATLRGPSGVLLWLDQRNTRG